jgi:hypothetical protein
MQKMYLLNEEERKVMGLLGREIVENHFDEHMVIAKYKNLIDHYRKKLSA